MMMEKSLVQLTHIQIMRMLPMGTGYLVEEDGKPCNWSLSVAMMVQAIAFLHVPQPAKLDDVN